MKTQRALRLRQSGKHFATKHSDVDWVWRFGLAGRTALAFEMNCAPKHSTEPNQEPYTTMDYVTGVYTWHGRVTFWPGPQTFNTQDFGSEIS